MSVGPTPLRLSGCLGARGLLLFSLSGALVFVPVWQKIQFDQTSKHKSSCAFASELFKAWAAKTSVG